MPPRSYSRFTLFACGLLLVLWAVPCVLGSLVWREWRQQHLNYALIAAIKRNDSRAAIQSLRQGADPNSRDRMLAQSAWKIFVRLLTDKKMQKPQGNPALALLFWNPQSNAAPSGDHYAVVKALLDRGADANPESAIGPLIVYAAAQGDTRSLRTLLQKGAYDHDVESCSSALWQIIMNKDPQDVETLLNKGADVNYDPGRCNMLCYAVWAEDEATVQILLKHGADPNRVCKEGVTALGMAKESKLAGIEKMLRRAGATR